MISKRILCVLAFFINLNCFLGSETYKSIMWDPQNPLFIEGKSNCDPAYKYKLLKIRSASKIKFICPNVATVMQTTLSEVSKSNKYENLWLLYNKTSFDKCDTKLDPANIKKPLLRCTKPTDLEFHSITFQPYAAEPNELTFHKGQSYYFMATSNGLISHINDTSGGHCNDTTNKVYMKIEVYVCNNTDNTDKGEDPKCKSGVGELICPKELTVTSLTTVTSTLTPTPSSQHVTVSSMPSEGGDVHTVTATKTTTVTTTANASINSTEAQKEPFNDSQKRTDPSDNECGIWKVMTWFFMCLIIVIIVAFIVLYFFCGKRKCRKYEHKITPSPEFGRKNHGFDVGNGSSVSTQGNGSLPRKDAGDLVIYNNEVFYNKAVDEAEENKENAPT